MQPPMPATKPPGQQSARRKPAELHSSYILNYTADPPRRPRNSLASWYLKGPRRKEPIYLVQIPPFSSRGMSHIYGRSDNYSASTYNGEVLRSIFGREIHCRIRCNLEVWQRKNGRIFVRFYATRKCLDSFSFELLGHPAPPDPKNSMGVHEEWIPEVVRDEYDALVIDCLDNPDNV